MAEKHTPRVAILASGSGTTAEFLIHATQTPVLDAEVGVVISNRSKAGVFGIVDRLNTQYGLDIAKMHISAATHPEGAGESSSEQTLAESEAIAEAIARGGFNLVLTSGYLKKVRGDLLREYGWQPHQRCTCDVKLYNTHPGPLPDTQGEWGIHVQEFVLANGLSHSGQTLHTVAADYDTGPIVIEHPVPVMPGDTPETLFAAVQSTEKTHLPVDVQSLLHGELSHAKLLRQSSPAV